jgi:hypothetical protein
VRLFALQTSDTLSASTTVARLRATFVLKKVDAERLRAYDGWSLRPSLARQVSASLHDRMWPAGGSQLTVASGGLLKGELSSSDAATVVCRSAVNQST